MSKSGTRAPNRMGSIRQRSDGRYEGRYTGADGRQHSVYGKSPKAVGEALREATHAVDAGTWLEPSSMTVGEWLEEWQRDYCTHTTQRTRDYYKRISGLYIVPTLGKVKLTWSAVKKDGLTVDALVEAGYTQAAGRILVSSAARDGRRVLCKISDKYGNTVKTDTVTLKMK